MIIGDWKACLLWLPLITACADTAAPEVQPVDSAVTRAPEVPYSAGYIAHDDGPITPYCAAVLVAPDVAVTAQYCLVGVSAFRLTVHFESPAGPVSSRAQRIVQQEEGELGALLLEEPIEHVQPAELGRPSSECSLLAATYSYVVSGEVVERRNWRGCVANETKTGWILHVAEGTPACHADGGAGVYDAETRALLGFVADADFSDPDGPPHPCFSGFGVVSSAVAEPFLLSL